MANEPKVTMVRIEYSDGSARELRGDECAEIDVETPRVTWTTFPPTEREMPVNSCGRSGCSQCDL
jgi:hypothetical protein